jgi:hypothetical protein
MKAVWSGCAPRPLATAARCKRRSEPSSPTRWARPSRHMGCSPCCTTASPTSAGWSWTCLRARHRRERRVPRPRRGSCRHVTLSRHPHAVRAGRVPIGAGGGAVHLLLRQRRVADLAAEGARRADEPVAAAVGGADGAGEAGAPIAYAVQDRGPLRRTGRRRRSDPRRCAPHLGLRRAETCHANVARQLGDPPAPGARSSWSMAIGGDDRRTPAHGSSQPRRRRRD